MSPRRFLRLLSATASDRLSTRSGAVLIGHGEIALDSRSDILALANALQISPSELVRLPVPAPGNGEAAAAEGAVRKALTAVSRNRPGGQGASS